MSTPLDFAPSPWAFRSYEKIAERTEQFGFDENEIRAILRTPWVVTEKIHGAHFCLVTDGQLMRVAKRKAFLEPNEEFFGYQNATNPLVDPALDLFRLARNEFEDVVRIAIHGELFGGHYPHPAVPPVMGVAPIQTGVWYCPSIEFLAFDIAIERANGQRIYIDYDHAIDWMIRTSMPFVPPLMTGPFDQCWNYPIGFDSRVPAQLGLPGLDIPNRAEGVVIKPLRSCSSEQMQCRTRPVLKRKIPEFAEDISYQGAQPWSAKTSTNHAFEALSALVRSKITENRLRCALSKLGPVAQTDLARREELSQALADDVEEAFRDELGRYFDELTAAEKNKLYRLMIQEARDLVEVFFAVYPNSWASA